MLRLKRKVGQKVLIKQHLELAVLELGADFAQLQLSVPGADTQLHSLRQGEQLRFEVLGAKVRVNLTAVTRGEALLEFDAPREVEIQRVERKLPNP
jgi:sRNA-binding carbon storage regulator CsrA